MKKIIYFMMWLCIPFLTGACFSDEGNYEYESIKPPTWTRDFMSSPIQISVREGRPIRIDGSKCFNWGKLDSLQRSGEVRYEWRFYGKVFCDELKAEIPYDEFMKRCGLDEIPISSFERGDFAIIEKSTGVSFKVLTTFYFHTQIDESDFLVYSAKSPNEPHVGKVNVMRLEYARDPKTGGYKTDFVLSDRHFSSDLPGTPKQLDLSAAKNVSLIGSATAITEEGDAYVLNAANLQKVWDLSSQFDEGIPDNFKVSARKDQEGGGTESQAFTWVATKDGRVFTRQFGKHYLGGKFLSEPYYLDSLGYKITMFGHTCWGITNIPCYDEKNKRVLVATSLQHNAYGSYRSYITVLKSEGWTGTPVMKMPNDTEVFYLTQMNGDQYWDNNQNSWFQIYFNTAGQSVVGTFSVTNRGRQLNMTNSYSYPYPVTGHLFNKETVFLTAAGTHLTGSSSKTYIDLFSEGNEVYGIKRSGLMWPGQFDYEIIKLPLKGITSKITSMTYNRDDLFTTSNYQHLVIGCENGDILVYDADELQNPTLKKKLNVGGKVVSIKQLGLIRASVDMY